MSFLNFTKFQTESEVTKLRDTVEELLRDREELRGILSTKKLLKNAICGGRSTPIFDGVSIADISVDDPMMTSPTKEGEVIQDTVILGLQENLTR